MKEDLSAAHAAPLRGAIFDLGNVLIRLRPIVAEAGSPLDFSGGVATDPLARLRADPVVDRLERGLATDLEFFEAVRRLFGLPLADGEIRRAYESVLGEPVAGMADLVAELRLRGVRVVGLSDISHTHLALVARYPAVAALEEVVASCRTGFRKPEPGAYRAALAVLGTRPEETVFVDDRPENVAGAAALGLRAFVFEGLEDLKARLGLAALTGQTP